MSNNIFRILFFGLCLIGNVGDASAEREERSRIPVQVGEDQSLAESFREGDHDDWDPARSVWDDMERMRWKLSKMMGDDLSGPDPAPYSVNRSRAGGMSADFFETEGEVTVTVDVPGFDRDELDIRVENQTLVIRGRKEAQVEQKDDQRQYHFRSRRTGSFERRFTIPSYADTNRIDASQSNGVLTIRIPKKDVPEPKKVEIRDGDSKD